MPVYEPQTIKNKIGMIGIRPSSKSAKYINMDGMSSIEKSKLQIEKLNENQFLQLTDEKIENLEFLKINSLSRGKKQEHRPNINRSFTSMGRPIQTSNKIKIRKDILENELIPIQHFWNDKLNHFK
jgi:hypothetical protein